MCGKILGWLLQTLFWPSSLCITRICATSSGCVLFCCPARGVGGWDKSDPWLGVHAAEDASSGVMGDEGHAGRRYKLAYVMAGASGGASVIRCIQMEGRDSVPGRGGGGERLRACLVAIDRNDLVPYVELT